MMSRRYFTAFENDAMSAEDCGDRVRALKTENHQLEASQADIERSSRPSIVPASTG